MSFLTPQQQQQQISIWLGQLVNAARQQPDGNFDIRDETGSVIATLHAHAVIRRPKDMPRALRPKQKLSKRTRDAAKREKLSPSPARSK